MFSFLGRFERFIYHSSTTRDYRVYEIVRGATTWGKVIRGLFDISELLLERFTYCCGGRSTTRRIRLLCAWGVTVKPKTFRKVVQKTIRGKRRGRAFEPVIARMAADLAIQAECAAITKDFAIAEADRLKQRLLRRLGL